jgi:hypothetical protein
MKCRKAFARTYTEIMSLKKVDQEEWYSPELIHEV